MDFNSGLYEFVGCFFVTGLVWGSYFHCRPRVCVFSPNIMIRWRKNYWQLLINGVSNYQLIDFRNFRANVSFFCETYFDKENTDVGLRLFAVGNTFRRLSAKCSGKCSQFDILIIDAGEGWL